MTRPPILILQPDRARPAAAVADGLARRGHATIACLLRSADDLPGRGLLDRVGGVVVLDAASCDAAGHAAVLDWLAECRARERPLLGIGRGGELLTRLLGGTVDADAPVRGWFPLSLRPPAASTPWLQRLGTSLPHGLLWQDRSWQPPPGAVPLLGSAPDACVAWAARGALALRVHIELTAALYARWLEQWAATPARHGLGWQDHASLAAASAAVGAQRVLAEHLLDAWLEPPAAPLP
ncbi:MAG: hypothetical protein KDK06_10845 [Gammaproteobacteria bacterium]|nr:hypothetical protein [Gammaproteobacteria bacterium]